MHRGQATERLSLFPSVSTIREKISTTLMQNHLRTKSQNLQMVPDQDCKALLERHVLLSWEGDYDKYSSRLFIPEYSQA
jgi:hypothetical protein